LIGQDKFFSNQNLIRTKENYLEIPVENDTSLDLGERSWLSSFPEFSAGGRGEHLPKGDKSLWLS